MFYRLLVLTCIATYCIPFGSCKTTNDTIIELTYNCCCIPYQMCAEAKDIMEAARQNLLPKISYCSNEDYFCCKRTCSDCPSVCPEVPEMTTTSTKRPETTPTTVKPSKPTTPKLEPPRTRKQNICDYNCGIAKTNIVVRILTPDTESASTIPGEVPWMVEIFQKQNQLLHPYRFKCPGTLIHPKVVLTVAHCIVSNVKKPESLRIIASGSEVFQNVGVRPDDERNVHKVIKHPEFSSGELSNDIALLILEDEYTFRDNFLNSVCLPRVDQNFDGRRCWGAGWGQNSELKEKPLIKVDVPIVDFERCQDLLRISKKKSDFDLHSSFICAGGEAGKDTCQGDGGGPLMCVSEYRYIQAGIISWGVTEGHCGLVDQPGIYVNVAQFTEWIKNELAKQSIELKC